MEEMVDCISRGKEKMVLAAFTFFSFVKKGLLLLEHTKTCININYGRYMQSSEVI